MVAEAEATLAEVAGILEADLAAFRVEDFGAAVDSAEAMHTVAADIAAISDFVVDSVTATSMVSPITTPAGTIRFGGTPVTTIRITTAILRMITVTSDTPTLLRRQRLP